MNSFIHAEEFANTLGTREEEVIGVEVKLLSRPAITSSEEGG